MDNETEPNIAHPNGDEVTSGVKSTRAIKLRVTDIEWLQDSACEGESPAAVLSRLREELRVAREQEIVLEAAIKEYGTMISQLNSDLETLRPGSRTAIAAPGQTAIGDFGGEMVKDAMDAIKDVCDDETVCVKTALHLLDKKAEVVGKQLDRDHTKDEKAKDRDHARDEKEKDRKLKMDIETRRAEHQKNLALIKKGIVKDADLEDVTFLGSTEKRKTPGERLAEKKKRAYHAANGEEDGDFVDPDDECFDDGEELGDADPAEQEDHDHA